MKRKDLRGSPFDTPKVKLRFYSYIDIPENEDDCWEWVRYKDADGYGKFTYNKRQRPAHRIMYQLEKGEIPDGMLVCHSCDNPSCVNPNHLWLGTVKDNSEDMVKKGRSLKGDKNPHYGLKLEECSRYVEVSEEVSIEIVKRIRINGEYAHKVAEDYPFSITVIRRLLKQFDGEI